MEYLIDTMFIGLISLLSVVLACSTIHGIYKMLLVRENRNEFFFFLLIVTGLTSVCFLAGLIVKIIIALIKAMGMW